MTRPNLPSVVPARTEVRGSASSVAYINARWASQPAASNARQASQPATVVEAVVYKPIVEVQDNSLAAPVLVEVERTSDQLIVSDLATGIFGVGNTATEVLTDFIAALHDHARVLSAQRALSSELQRQLAYLQRHLKP